ncbi:MAG: hypothetical protein L0Y74_03760, partial [candidate division Zixibacteria bacterium]|nr:hypothetical protein [candidate division Zixibacteria bacterium]
RKVKNKVEQNFVKSFIMGILYQFPIVPLVFLVLFITIIGIPVAVILLPMLILFAFVLGFTAISMNIGEKIRTRFRVGPDTPTVTILIGMLAVFSVIIIWAVFDLISVWLPILSGVSLIFLLITLAVLYLIATAGFGAAVMTRLGTRPKDAPVPVTAPPPTATGAQMSPQTT